MICQSKQATESEIYNKNPCFHAVPDSIWEDNSRNCRLCHISKSTTLKRSQQHQHYGRVRRPQQNDHSEQGHIQAFARDGESPKDNITLLGTFLHKFSHRFTQSPLVNSKMYKRIVSRTDHRA